MAHLLLVDDDPAVLKALVRRLATTYTCTTARNGVDAMHKMLRPHDVEFPFDLVISDVDMPLMTGLDLYRWMSERYPGQTHKLVFYTGSNFPRLESLCVPNNRKGSQLDQTLREISLYLLRGVAPESVAQS